MPKRGSDTLVAFQPKPYSKSGRIAASTIQPFDIKSKIRIKSKIKGTLNEQLTTNNSLRVD